ncbi:MAG TPA: NAD(P)/FAD-dependent oxidoreductase [Clostridiaceae bacterium]|nr:NAD(P)/FAD-dependent oxidoreductase [Clostridiaceae bacterium]
MYDVIIIGCGIVGTAAAYELSKYNCSVAVLEKENDVACGTTKANSAIIHSGYDTKPGTLMARLNVEGAKLAKELCRRLDVPYKQIGSLVLAFSQEDLSILKKLYDQGIRNGVQGLELLTAEQVKKMEPNISPDILGALYSPTGAIVTPWEYALAMAETAVRNGVDLYLNSGVYAIEKIGNGYKIATQSGEFHARYVLNAAGVHADKIHNMVAEPEFSIKPVKGEYYLLDKSEGTRVSHTIFQCPGKMGKGVLVSPTVHGNLIVGPNAENISDAEDVSTSSHGLSFVAEMALKSVPSINFRQAIRNFAGVRATSDIDDFIIAESKTAKGFINLAGIKSPGLTAAPAIARMAVELLQTSGLNFVKKEDFIDTRHQIRFNQLPIEEKRLLIEENPLYGRVICRCETITEGEIVDALHSPIPPRSLDGVKRRANAGMGRCQGGFCGPRVLEIIARELKLQPEKVLLDKEGTYILTGETKTGGGCNE